MEGEVAALTRFMDDDLLIHILSCLSTRERLSLGALVCRRWKRAVKACPTFELTPPTFACADRPWGSLTANAVVGLAKAQAENLRVLRLQGLFRRIALPSELHKFYTNFLDLLSHLPRLTELAITSFKELPAKVFESAIFPPTLEVLDLHQDHMHHRLLVLDRTEPSVTDSLLQAVASRCRNLKVLNCDVRSSVTDTGLEHFAAAMPGLTSCSLQSNGIGWSTVAHMLAACSNLQHLSVISDKLQGEAPKLPERPSLVSLRLYHNLHRSVQWDSSSKSAILRGFGAQLTTLYAEGTFNASWEIIGGFCTNLEALDLSTSGLPPSVLTQAEVSVLLGMLRRMPKMRQLALPAANDAVLVDVAHWCPLLRDLRFQAGTCCRPRFSSIENRLKLPVTSMSVRLVAQKLPQLRVLSLTGCQLVNDSAISFIGLHCKHLQVLELGMCTNLTDGALFTLITRVGSSLLTLDVRWNNREAFVEKFLDVMEQDRPMALRLLRVKRFKRDQFDRYKAIRATRRTRIDFSNWFDWHGHMYARPGVYAEL